MKADPIDLLQIGDTFTIPGRSERLRLLERVSNNLLRVEVVVGSLTDELPPLAEDRPE